MQDYTDQSTGAQVLGDLWRDIIIDIIDKQPPDQRERFIEIAREEGVL